MSAPEERGALPPASLYSCALRLLRAEPDGRLPEGGYALPDPPERRPRTRTSWKSACEALTEVLTEALTPPTSHIDTGTDTGTGTDAPGVARAAEEIHLRLAGLSIRGGHVQSVVTGLPLADEDWARALGRCLTRTGTSPMAVCAGLALLTRLGEPEDVPYLGVLGRLRDLADHAVRALDPIDSPTAALVWLGHHARGPELRGLVDALAAGEESSVPGRLEAVLRKVRAVRPETARRVAEAVRLADLLREARPGEAGLVAGAGRLLRRISGVNDYRAEVLACPVAVGLFEAFAVRAAELPPTLDHHAILLSVALELHSGPSRLLEWGTGRREALLNRLESVLGRPAWRALLAGGSAEDGDPAGQRRLDWARRTVRQPFRRDAGCTGPAGWLRIEATVLDPVDPDIVETRILIDGRPLVPAAFGRGGAHAPEYLLDSGRLRATDEPREVQLAEAYCTEGCCGALHVTIRRDGDHVIWSHWRRPTPPPSLLPARELPEYRFEAAAYDAEIARAENDHSWAWPARKTARLIAAGLRDRPDLLTRWDVEPGWIGTDFRDRDRTVVTLGHRAGPSAGQGEEDAHRQHLVWHVPDDGTTPEHRAAAALHRLATVDPRTYGGGGTGRSARST
ncbi:hypothetical protein OG298_19775 [Streptomyces sp. NBC_01005]|uniref:hypothetical protein n=1 Tax=unclassified Streptomyces TaxID=2593676 RepID=UPI0038661F84|nr:hypothetical protein OG298_19775 [Streptomyces sp. NBC_01005]WTC95949.1 hypothetical protein OH736_19790 [Streptomyces sp. NBC_01650]